MKSRFTILSTVGAFLLVLGLAITPGFAQDLSLDVDKTQTMAVDSGHNQKMGKLIFTAAATDDGPGSIGVHHWRHHDHDFLRGA